MPERETDATTSGQLKKINIKVSAVLFPGAF